MIYDLFKTLVDAAAFVFGGLKGKEFPEDHGESCTQAAANNVDKLSDIYIRSY